MFNVEGLQGIQGGGVAQRVAQKVGGLFAGACLRCKRNGTLDIFFELFPY